MGQKQQNFFEALWQITSSYISSLVIFVLHIWNSARIAYWDKTQIHVANNPFSKEMSKKNEVLYTVMSSSKYTHN